MTLQIRFRHYYTIRTNNLLSFSHISEKIRSTLNPYKYALIMGSLFARQSACQLSLLRTANSCVSVFVFDRHYRVRTDVYVELLPSIAIHIDGSKTKRGTDAGIFSLKFEFNLELVLHDLATVFQVEVLTIQHGTTKFQEGALRNGLLSFIVTVTERIIKRTHITGLSIGWQDSTRVFLLWDWNLLFLFARLHSIP